MEIGAVATALIKRVTRGATSGQMFFRPSGGTVQLPQQFIGCSVAANRGQRAPGFGNSPDDAFAR
jgi:hypothetical protein